MDLETTLAALTPLIVNAFLAIASAVIAAVGLAVRNFVTSKFNASQLAILGEVATIGVQAAEQLYGTFDGATKKDFALDFIQAELARRGVKVDVEAVEAALEAAVMAEFNYPAAVTPAEPPTETVVVTEAGGTASDQDSV